MLGAGAGSGALAGGGTDGLAGKLEGGPDVADIGATGLGLACIGATGRGLAGIEAPVGGRFMIPGTRGATG